MRTRQEAVNTFRPSVNPRSRVAIFVPRRHCFCWKIGQALIL